MASTNREEPARSTGRFECYLTAGWYLCVEQDFTSQATGPTRLVLEAIPEVDQNDDVDFGAFDSAGIDQAMLRAIPMREARKELEKQRLEFIAEGVAARIPSNFTELGTLALARLAYEYVMLWGIGVRNPVTVISRVCEPHVQGTWAARVRRCRELGFLVGGDKDPNSPKEPSFGAAAAPLLNI